MSRYRLTEAAQQDVRDILEYLEDIDPAAERNVRLELRRVMEFIARTPGAGRRLEGVDDEPVRVWLAYSYLVVYRARTRPVEILRVVHGSRDVRRVLRVGE